MRPRAGAAAVIVIAAIVYLPSLGTGLLADDLWWMLALADPGAGIAPYDLDLSDPFWSRHGVTPWWADPSMRWAFFRPLSVAMWTAQHRLFGADPLGYHVVSWLGVVALVASAWPIYRRLLPERVAVVALALFALHPSHVQLATFLSAAHATWSTIPALWGWTAWLRWRDGAAWGLPLAIVGFGVGLLAGETAVEVLVLVAAGDVVRRDVRAGIPVGLALAYVVLYVVGGYGVRGSGLYADPAGDPVGFAIVAVERLPAAVGGALGVVPPEAWGVAPAAPLAFVVALAVVALAAVVPRTETSFAALVGTIGAIVPTLAVVPAGRLLLCATLGSCALLALAVTSGRWLAAPFVVSAIGGAVFVVVQVVRTPGMAAAVRDPAVAAELANPVVVLTAPGPMTASYLLPARTIATSAPPPSWTVLSSAPYAHRIARPAADHLDVTVIGGRMMERPYDRWARAEALRAGDVVDRGDLVARVLEDDGVGPTRVSFEIDAAAHLVTWQDGALVPVAIAVGEAIEIPASRSPFGGGL